MVPSSAPRPYRYTTKLLETVWSSARLPVYIPRNRLRSR